MEASILIVEDDPGIRELLQVWLQEAGYRTREAASGPEALDLLQAERPELIVLDLMLPGMSGIQFCKRLKQDPALGNIPVLVVTALRELSTKEAALESGADDFVVKPISENALLPRVKALLQVQGVRQGLNRALAYLQVLDDAPPPARPAAPPPREDFDAFAPPRAASDRGTILIIEETPITRDFYGSLLGDQGFTVLRASTIREGLKILGGVPVEAVILAERMAGGEEREVLARLRGTQPGLPILLLVEDTRSINRALALRQGVFDLVCKDRPISLASLAVSRAVRYARGVRREGPAAPQRDTGPAGPRDTVE